LAYQFGNTIIVEDEEGEVLKKYDIPAPAKRPALDRMTSFTDGGGRTMQRLRNMGTYLGVHPHHQHDAGDGAAGPSGTTHETAEERERKKKRKEDDNSDDEHIRFTVTADGRRMSKNEFIQQIQKMDPKSRAQLVESSNAPEAVKHEARRDAKEHAARKRAASAVNIPPVVGERDEAQQQHVESPDAGRRAGPESLTLVDSQDQDVPFHSVSAALASYSLDRTAHPETAAQRRRREATHAFPRADVAPGDSDAETPPPPPPPQDASDESPAERRRRMAALGVRASPGAPSPPGTVRPQPRSRSRSHMDEDETAAERRRRLGALGIARDEGGDSESSEDEEAGDPLATGRRPHGRGGAEAERPRQPGIRFAELPEIGSRTGTGGTGNGSGRLRWGENVGRKGKR
jgi:hypothetical protein